MEIADIQEGLKGFTEPLSSQTYLYTYKVQRRDSLLSDGLGTRANSIWKMAQYIVAKYDNESEIPLSRYLSGWEVLTKNHGNQFLIIATDEFNWEMYDSNCKLLGRNEEIISYLKRQSRPVFWGGETSVPVKLDDKTTKEIKRYLTAIRTKPFLLLAGISGTGKSRIVRELAFKSCPKYLQDNDGVTPGNYCMIEVKPNWHDSTELLGYYSNLAGEYRFTKFVRFLVKAKMNPDVPFFVCLDEMNLAPVEQYFAEILSVMETRKHVDLDGKRVIKTGVIIEPRFFKELLELKGSRDSEGKPLSIGSTDRDIYLKLFSIDTEDDIEGSVGNRTELTTEGLTLPENVVMIGTVNMDDTTHQFSRKVIDRAMTIEMNGGRLMDMFEGVHDLEYLPVEDQQQWQRAFRQKYVMADEVLKEHYDEAEEIKKKLTQKLEKINEALRGTPFEVSYRVLNELVIMLGVMMDDEPEEELDVLVDRAVDQILLMKILPRIEGDRDMFALSDDYRQRHSIHHANRLEWLCSVAPQISVEEKSDGGQEGTSQMPTQQDGQAEERIVAARTKIREMIDRLDNQDFTRFWP